MAYFETVLNELVVRGAKLLCIVYLRWNKKCEMRSIEDNRTVHILFVLSQSLIIFFLENLVFSKLVSLHKNNIIVNVLEYAYL